MYLRLRHPRLRHPRLRYPRLRRIANPQERLAELRISLTPSGIAILITPNGIAILITPNGCAAKREQLTSETRTAD